MFNFGVAGYQPTWLNRRGDVVRGHAHRLRGVRPRGRERVEINHHKFGRSLPHVEHDRPWSPSSMARVCSGVASLFPAALFAGSVPQRGRTARVDGSRIWLRLRHATQPPSGGRPGTDRDEDRRVRLREDGGDVRVSTKAGGDRRPARCRLQRRRRSLGAAAVSRIGM